MATTLAHRHLNPSLYSQNYCWVPLGRLPLPSPPLLSSWSGSSLVTMRRSTAGSSHSAILLSSLSALQFWNQATQVILMMIAYHFSTHYTADNFNKFLWLSNSAQLGKLTSYEYRIHNANNKLVRSPHSNIKGLLPPCCHHRLHHLHRHLHGRFLPVGFVWGSCNPPKYSSKFF